MEVAKARQYIRFSFFVFLPKTISIFIARGRE